MVAVYSLSRRRETHLELVAELTEERRLLADLRTTVQEELEAAQAKARSTLDRAVKLATEAEQEVKTGAQTIAKEMELVVSELTEKFADPLKELSRKQSYLESMLRRVEDQKTSLQNLLARGEKICRLLDSRVPLEDVIAEIEDKKYADARLLLARGRPPAAVAVELGMSETEVRLVAGLTGPVATA
jgi:F0F1-type ATP synthase membrane subunit b/b'